MIKIYEIKVFIVMLSAIFTIALVWVMSFDMCEITKFCQVDSYSNDNKSNIYIEKGEGEVLTISVEIADTPREIEKGLMYRENLATDSGMIFIMPYESNWSFWMKNTLIPLDMIFVSKDLEIVYILERAEPCVIENCGSYSAGQEVLYIIEVNGDWTLNNGVKVGNKVVFNI